MKKKRFAIFSFAIIIAIMIINYFIKRNNVNITDFLITNIIILIINLVIQTNIKNKRIKLIFSSFIIILLLLGTIFSSFSFFSFILLYFFILLITITVMEFTKYDFKISIVLAISLLIVLFIIFSLLNILYYSKLFLLLIAILSAIFLYKKKDSFLNGINSLDITSLVIFTIIFIVSILSGIERYVHSWDEYSYWGYAAKVCINEKSFYSVIARAGETKSYPPVLTIWHYIVSSFSNKFSEPNLYIGLTLLILVYMIPVLINIIDKDRKNLIVFMISVFAFPLLFSGSYTYTLLYADLLLASMCTTALILHNLYKKGDINKRIYLLILVLITLLKPNGFVFSLTILLLFYLKDIFNHKISIKNIFYEIKKYLVPGLLIMSIYVTWTFLTKSTLIKPIAYNFKLIPIELKADLGLKLNAKFILDFITGLIKSIDSSIIFSFINIPLFVYLIILTIFIYMVECSEYKENKYKILLPYIISYVVFYCVTALSLFVMFSIYEAENLASFQRYLNPINISFFLMCMYKITNLKSKNATFIVSIIIIALVGFSGTTFFLTDLRDRRDTKHISIARQKAFKEVINKTEENSRVFIINQTDENSIMPLWYARYYCYPRTINANSGAITWKVRTKENSWDLQKWGLTDKKLEKHLIEYDFDYIFFYSITDELEKEIDEFVDDIDEYKKVKLFKIVKENDSIKFEPVK